MRWRSTMWILTARHERKQRRSSSEGRSSGTLSRAFRRFLNPKSLDTHTPWAQRAALRVARHIPTPLLDNPERVFINMTELVLGVAGLVPPEGCIFFFQAEDGIRFYRVTGVQTCALP